MNTLKRQLMIQAAKEHLRAAEALRGVVHSSESEILLRLLAFELLLKLLVEVTAGAAPTKHHNFRSLFEGLHSETQREVLQLARARIFPSGLDHNALSILEELGRNFVAVRYPYERYEGLSEIEYKDQGDSWLTEGAPLEGATFRFYPEELFGLTAALQRLIGCEGDFR